MPLDRTPGSPRPGPVRTASAPGARPPDRDEPVDHVRIGAAGPIVRVHDTAGRLQVPAPVESWPDHWGWTSRPRRHGTKVSATQAIEAARLTGGHPSNGRPPAGEAYDNGRVLGASIATGPDPGFLGVDDRLSDSLAHGPRCDRQGLEDSASGNTLVGRSMPSLTTGLGPGIVEPRNGALDSLLEREGQGADDCLKRG